MGSPMSHDGAKKAPKLEKTSQEKWKYTLYTTVLFLVVVNPMTYKIVQALLGRFVKIAASDGCPTMAGILVHAVVFTLLLRYMMDLKV
tara:strand:+ start:1543 stop:1806 length:264 start_codon:yes stop_codon:yes gene_type:complete